MAGEYIVNIVVLVFGYFCVHSEVSQLEDCKV